MLLVIFSPLLNFILIAMFGLFIGMQGSGLLSIFFLIISNLILWINCYDILINHNYIWIDLNIWIESGLFQIKKGFLFDSLSLVMTMVVSFISLLIHIYSIEYMKNDPHLPRFMSFLSIFTFFMLLLITSNNFIQMFIGWEGVGLCSFLLINFWFTRINANKAAMKAIIVNRIGDFGLTLGICLIFYIYKSVNFFTLFSLVVPHSLNNILFLNSYYLPLDIICFLLFIGSVGKSAQLGLHIWLPDAMEGPTPVSALIHAATMVTAGVFLIIRTSIFFEYAPNILLIITLVGGLTCFFAAVSGLLQHDLKKVIAYSTCSQLGYMIFSCGLSNYTVSLFHLVNHAFFKALLFLSAGAIIHSLHDEQDIRKMGGLIYSLPLTYFFFFVGSLSLCGFPFFSGFYSKDLVLEVTFASYSISSQFIFWLGSISALLTSFYTFRLIYFVFIQRTNSFKSVFLKVHEVSLIMGSSLILLTLKSIFGGILFFDMFVGAGSTFWGNSIFILPQNYSLNVIEFIPIYIKIIPIVFSLIGISSVFFIYESNLNLLLFFKIRYLYVYNFILSKWYFDKVFNNYLIKQTLIFGYYTTFKMFDKGLYETLGPNGLTNFCIHFSSQLSKKIQNGVLYNFFIISISFWGLLLLLIYENAVSNLLCFEIILLLVIISIYEIHVNCYEL